MSAEQDQLSFSVQPRDECRIVTQNEEHRIAVRRLHRNALRESDGSPWEAPLSAAREAELNREDENALRCSTVADDVPGAARRTVQRSEPGEFRTARPRAPRSSPRHHLQPRHRQVHQQLRLAGQGVRRQRRACCGTRYCRSASMRSSPRSTRRRAGSTARNASSSTTPTPRCVAQWIRDEIREISPGVYLGKVYWGRQRLIDFALEF